MNEIHAFNLSQLRMEESFGFHKLAANEMTKCEDTKFASVKQAYTDALQRFDEALKQGGGKSALTLPIQQQDATCDNLYRGLAAQIKSMTGYFDPDTAELARQAEIILQKYGNPTALPYLEEMGVLHNLIQELEAFDGESETESPGELRLPTSGRLAAIHADGWVSQLKSEVARFEELFAQRNAQNATIETGVAKAARQETDNAYRAAVKRLNALAEVNGEADYIDVINALNTLIDRQQAILKARATRGAKKDEPGEGGEDTENPEEI